MSWSSRPRKRASIPYTTVGPGTRATSACSSSTRSRTNSLNLNERFDVSPGKVEALKARIARLNIDLRLVEESFSRGGGKGGQKLNKTSNRVQLHYPPLDLRVACQKDRRRTVNRFLALRELVDRIEARVSPGTSQRVRKVERARKRKARRRERAGAKYGAA